MTPRIYITKKGCWVLLMRSMGDALCPNGINYRAHTNDGDFYLANLNSLHWKHK